MAKAVPPQVNGVMDLTEEEILSIQAELVVIQEAFEPDDYVVYCDTQYLVSHYNDAHQDLLINGDTAEYCLQYVKEETVEEDPAQVDTPPTE